MAFVLAPLLLVLLCPFPPLVRAAEHEHGDDYYMVVAVSSLKPKASSYCLGHRVIPPPNGTWIPVDLPHGPCSLSSSNAAAPPSVAELLRRDQRRADDVQRRLFISKNGTNDSKADKPPADTDESELNTGARTQVEMGTTADTNSKAMSFDPAATVGGSGAAPLRPGVIQTVVLDTASDVPWVQCVPCPVPPCHPQTDTFYDPTKSPTYAAFSCGSPSCRQLGPYANGCVNNQCQYRVTYPVDGSSTSGTYSSDLLTLNPNTRINNFKFGCSHVDQGNFDNTTAGIMALGGGPESLASQTASTYGRAFSYCIPPSASYFGFFVLGMPRAASSSRYVVTPMLRDKRAPATFYRVQLRAITVGGQRLSVPATVFAAGTVLDSRTSITRLPPTAYQALRDAFRRSMSMYRAAAPKGSLDTCYDFTGVRSVKLPKVALVFDGDATVQLDPSGVLFHDCLAFTSSMDDRMPGILGNVQQQTIEVLYNVGGGSVGFRRNAC
ncbi:aspartyl protease family protein At5g10770-like [Miscanthus floridulus]|uniref:aspartyl protease family protein At5g10770-like n=1 Tax=Miscanthus floridulus TaxID=154761 RepID=UPI00345A4FB8